MSPPPAHPLDGEAQVIQRLLRDGGHAPLAPGTDDAALTPEGAAVSVDTMVEGVHFDEKLSPADVGWKLVAVNASDIGACGRLPSWALLALSLPRPLDLGWVDAFAEGLHEALDHWQIALLGGDTTRSPGPILASLTIGAPPGPCVARRGARPGDDLWITGRLGASAAGFLRGDPEGLRWLRRPQPPVAFGAALGRAGLPSAMMDLSDGLKLDLHRLAATSAVGAEVWPEHLPAHPAAEGALDLLTAFGEDYQLLFSAPPDVRSAIEALAEAQHVRVTCVGRVREAAAGVRLRGAADWPAGTFAHF